MATPLQAALLRAHESLRPPVESDAVPRMKRAKYLRPVAIEGLLSHFDDQVVAWLLTQGLEVVDEYPEILVYLPYDGGGGYYHQVTSPDMAMDIASWLGAGDEVRAINVRNTLTSYRPGKDGKYETVLNGVDLGWCDPTNHGGKVTLAVMTGRETEQAEIDIQVSRELAWQELGERFEPKGPPTPIPAAYTASATYGRS